MKIDNKFAIQPQKFVTWNFRKITPTIHSIALTPKWQGLMPSWSVLYNKKPVQNFQKKLLTLFQSVLGFQKYIFFSKIFVQILNVIEIVETAKCPKIFFNENLSFKFYLCKFDNQEDVDGEFVPLKWVALPLVL